jgi:hypothetical protein
MNLGIDVTFIHTPHRVGPTFFASFIDPDESWLQLAQRKAVEEGQ